MYAGDPACDLAACWILLPDGFADRCYEAYQPTPDLATQCRARGWAVLHALGRILIGHAGDHGRPGGKHTWGPPAHAALRRLTATVLGKTGSDQAERRQAVPGQAKPGTAPVPAGSLTSAPTLTCDNSAAGGTRTPDLLVRSQLLYPLSYSRILLIRIRCSIR
jgi:hypothetical protein